eukprot:2878064-Prymnesium_polylepis.1
MLSLSLVVVHAPNPSKSLTSGTCPEMAAYIKGVHPAWQRAFTSLPRSISCAASSDWFRSAAVWRAVHPAALVSETSDDAYLVSLLLSVVPPDPASRAQAVEKVTEVSSVFARWTQEGARGWSPRSAAAAEGTASVLPDAQGVWDVAQTSTDGGRRAPFALGDDDERVTRGLRIESLAAAAACALTRGSLSADQPPPPPSSARTA